MAKFSDILKKAEKRTRKYPDYVLEIGDESYNIPYPDALQMLEFSELDDDQMLKQLQVIFQKNPSAWNALVFELRDEDASVLNALVEDIFNFWRMNDKTPGKSEK